MNEPSKTRYWVNSVSQDHVKLGVEGGFMQADHGRSGKLGALSMGDYLVFYSPRTSYRNGDPLQMFTALGQIVDDEAYQVQISPDFQPWRRAMKFFRSRRVAVRDLLDELSFIANKEKWGLSFRQGLFAIDQADFERIAKAMGVKEER